MRNGQYYFACRNKTCDELDYSELNTIKFYTLSLEVKVNMALPQYMHITVFQFDTYVPNRVPIPVPPTTPPNDLINDDSIK